MEEQKKDDSEIQESKEESEEIKKIQKKSIPKIAVISCIIAITIIVILAFSIPLDKHEHEMGDWEISLLYENEIDCEKKYYVRKCSGCNLIDSKFGEYEDHNFITVTTNPTCTTGGYDTKTCKLCDKTEITNYTDPSGHDYTGNYITDSTYHLKKCKKCNETTKRMHERDKYGICLVCDPAIQPTEGVVYDISSDRTHAEVRGYIGSSTTVKIAAEYEGLPVKVIVDSAFKDKDKIYRVVIPDSVTSIGGYAFAWCDSLTSVILGFSVASIGDNAFWSCSKLKSVTLVDSITSIGSNAFYGCHSFLYTEYKYAKYWGDTKNPYAYLLKLSYDNLSSYEIHADTRVVAGSVFSNCNRLESITIPESVTHIGEYAFMGCDTLKNVYITDINAWCKIDFYGYSSNPLYYAKNLYLNGNIVTDIVIPNSVTSIGNYAFSHFSGLTSVTIPTSVIYIGEEAFGFCDNFKNVYYTGSKADWVAISIQKNNYTLEYVVTINYDYKISASRFCGSLFCSLFKFSKNTSYAIENKDC